MQGSIVWTKAMLQLQAALPPLTHDACVPVA
jgi:hypothetical protein